MRESILVRPRGRSARGLTMGASALTASALVVLGAIAPASATTGDPAESSSQFVTVSDLDLSAADLAGTYASAPGGPAIDTAVFNAAAFGVLADNVALLNGGHAQVPLVYNASVPEGLLAVGQGDIVGYSESPDVLSSFAASGAVDAATGEFTEVSNGGSVVNLDAAFEGLGVQPVTRHILSQIELEVGTAASQAFVEAYSGASGNYRLDGLSLQLTSPLLQELPGVIDVTLQGATALAQEVLEAALPGGVLPLPAGTIPDIPVGVGTLVVNDASLTVTAPNFNGVVSDVMSTPGGVAMVSDDGIATVNLNTGEITIDLAPLFGGGMNNQPANTEVFTDANMAAISAAVANALSKTTPLFATGVTDALHATQLGMSVDVGFVMAPNSATPNLNNLTVAGGTLTGSGSLDHFANGTSVFSSTLAQTPGLPNCARPLLFGVCLAPTSVIVGGAILGINTAVPTVAPDVIAVLAQPLMEALAEAENAVIAEIEPLVASVYGEITGAFDGLMPALATVVINEQSAGDLGPDSFTVRAFGVTMLPEFPHTSRAHIGLASATVLAIADPSVVIAETEVQSGTTTAITGAGWNPAGGPVTLVFTNEAGDPVGDPFTAEVAADGAISASWAVPAGTPDGELTLTATQGELIRTDTVNVHTSVVPPKPGPTPDPKPAGDKLPNTGSDFPFLLLSAAGLTLLAGGILLASRLRRQ